MSTEHYIAPTKAPSVSENADMLAVMQRLGAKIGVKEAAEVFNSAPERFDSVFGEIAPGASAPKGLPAEEAAQNG